MTRSPLQTCYHNQKPLLFSCVLHSRIFHVHNDGTEEVFVGSTDWMPRHLDRRVETITPVETPALLKQLCAILAIFLTDNCHAWDLQPDGTTFSTIPQKLPPNTMPKPS